MKKMLTVLATFLIAGVSSAAVTQTAPSGEGCLSCHGGIEKILPDTSAMMAQIQAIGSGSGDPEGCVVCHGGDPKGTSVEAAHKGAPEALKNGNGPKTFYPDPGSVWIAEHTCGQCHAGYAYRVERSLMNTEAGKVQGNLHTWGIAEVQNYKLPWGNYDVKDTDGQVPQVGSAEYKDYMKTMIAAHGDQFPTELKQVPLPSVEEIEKDPKLAGFTYQRQQCQRCHVGVKGREKRGDYRGMGCSSCHIPYGNEGYSRPENPKGGLLCQDCHTTVDMHGDGNIFGTTLAQVEIECQDCHGTTEKFPWELPLGYSEEFAEDIAKEERGLASEVLPETAAFATTYDKRDGHLKTARGNPFGNVVKDGKQVVLHSATGVDFRVPLLKQLKLDNNWKSPDAMVAMSRVRKHSENLECYACHASWVPQCYGCHVQVNYGKDKNGKPHQDTDWIAGGSRRDASGQTAESPLGTHGIKSPGKVFETRAYLRWEEPVLGINGEGRVTPLMPGCQIVYTVFDRNNKVVALNQLGKSEDERVALDQERTPDAIDMAPVQPHSAQRKARACESCHNNPKALGYGISGGVFQTRYPVDIVEDLIDQKTGQVIPGRYQIQIPKIADLDYDWSTIIKDGQQVQTVGTHWPLSRALPKEVRDGMERTGLCLGCHREMTNAPLWAKVSTPDTLSDDEHIEMLNRLLKTYASSKK